jgi:DNA processing protein
LIKINKANLLVSVRDLEYIMNWNLDEKPAQGKTLSLFDMTGFNPDEQQVMQLLKEKNVPVFIDELSFRSRIPPGKLASVLLNLEFAGWVVSLPGKQFKLAKGGQGIP